MAALEQGMHLGELGDQFPGADKPGDGGPLRIKPEARLALPVGGNAIAGNKALYGIAFCGEPAWTVSFLENTLPYQWFSL
jgi:hypothetical protein